MIVGPTYWNRTASAMTTLLPVLPAASSWSVAFPPLKRNVPKDTHVLPFVVWLMKTLVAPVAAPTTYLAEVVRLAPAIYQTDTV